MKRYEFQLRFISYSAEFLKRSPKPPLKAT